MSATQPARRNRRPRKRELFCPKCGGSHWCHVIKDDAVLHTVRWAPRELWEQVAHMDPTAANPTVSDYTRRHARRNAIKRVDGKRFVV
ncbi:MAG: hypothetical protein ACON4T_03365 [Synechococcus sp.]